MFKRWPDMIGALCLLLSFPAASALQLDSTYLATVRQGMELAFVDNYDCARQVFEIMIVADSTDHAAYLFLAGVYHAEMIDREDYSQVDTFSALIDKAISQAESALATGGDTAWAELTIGNAHGYLAAYEGKTGSWWQAVKQGVKAKGHWLDALKRDSTLYDAYLGLGNYHYWKSARTEFVNWLPFVKDRKEQGIEELQLATDSALFSQTMAASSLVWIYLDNERPFKALALAHKLEERYPTSRMVLWALAFTTYSSGQYDRALVYFGRIIDQLERQDQNYFNLIECRYHRARILEHFGDDEGALKECQLLLGYPAPEETLDRQKDKLNEIKRLSREIEKRIGAG